MVDVKNEIYLYKLIIFQNERLQWLSVTIGDSVTSIGNSAFSYCSKLTSIVFNDTTTWYITSSVLNWNNKTGGTQTSVNTPTTNATYFKSTYFDYYWYKK